MNDIILEAEKYDPAQSQFHFQFLTYEETGIIRFFDVSDEGRVATCIGSGTDSINIYDAYGYYNFTIHTNITRTRTILQWDNDMLLLYLNSGSSYNLVKIKGYEDYEIYSCPVNADTERFWNGLEQHQNELITDKGRYYVQYGNLRYTDYESGADYAVTENTSFQPWWLLSIPILTAIIWFGFAKKRVKKWEEKQKHERKI